MTLRLNNQELQGKAFNVNIKLPFTDSDMSGQSSGTDSAEQGIKSKELTVSYIVPFENAAYLTQIIELAEALDTQTSRRVVYRIGHDASNAINFYQAKFAGELNIQEMTDIQGWTVTFTMKEKLSVPERKGQRVSLSPAQQQTRGGDTETGITAPNNEALPPNTNLTDTERFFKNIDDSLGGYMNTPVEDTANNEI